VIKAPNDAHRAIAQSSRVAHVITQNVDGLHQRAGSSEAAVTELHGTLHTVVCMGCGVRP